MKATLLIIPALFLASCENCQQKFTSGEIVAHRVISGRFLIIRQSKMENFEGFCLVTVRDQKGNLWDLDVSEFTESKP